MVLERREVSFSKKADYEAMPHGLTDNGPISAMCIPKVVCFDTYQPRVSCCHWRVGSGEDMADRGGIVFTSLRSRHLSNPKDSVQVSDQTSVLVRVHITCMTLCLWVTASISGLGDVSFQCKDMLCPEQSRRQINHSSKHDTPQVSSMHQRRVKKKRDGTVYK